MAAYDRIRPFQPFAFSGSDDEDFRCRNLPEGKSRKSSPTLRGLEDHDELKSVILEKFQCLGESCGNIDRELYTKQHLPGIELSYIVSYEKKSRTKGIAVPPIDTMISSPDRLSPTPLYQSHWPTDSLPLWLIRIPGISSIDRWCMPDGAQTAPMKVAPIFRARSRAACAFGKMFCCPTS